MPKRDPHPRRLRRGTTPPLPALITRVVEDAQALARAVDTVIKGDRRAAELAVDITVAQARIRKLVGREAWTLYLRTEELVAQRASELTLTVARWAFSEGQKRRRKR